MRQGVQAQAFGALHSPLRLTLRVIHLPRRRGRKVGAEHVKPVPALNPCRVLRGRSGVRQGRALWARRGVVPALTRASRRDNRPSMA